MNVYLYFRFTDNALFELSIFYHLLLARKLMTGDDWKVSKCLFEICGENIELKTSLVIFKVNRILFKNFVLVDQQGVFKTLATLRSHRESRPHCLLLVAGRRWASKRQWQGLVRRKSLVVGLLLVVGSRLGSGRWGGRSGGCTKGGKHRAHCQNYG